MCGRFSLGLSHDEIEQVVQVGRWRDRDRFVPRFNIAPRTQAPVLRRTALDTSSVTSEGSRDELQTMTWGLVPHWSKHQDKSLNTINARSENIVDGAGMWASVKKNRCAVLCQGYYEWLKKGKDRWPHFTQRQDGKLMLLAGLYDCVTLEGATEPMWSFTIVTTAANKEFEWLHDRQPVILSSTSALDMWLDPNSQTWTTELTKLVEPYHDLQTPLQCYPVPKEVGKVGAESSTFIVPISNRKDGIHAMFSKQKQKQSLHDKRKRSSSAAPVIDLTLEAEDSTQKTEPLSKKRKDVRDLDDPSRSQSQEVASKSELSKTKSKVSPPKSQSSKITTFFSKT